VTETPGGRRLPRQRLMLFVWGALAAAVIAAVIIVAVLSNGSDKGAGVTDRPSKTATTSASPSSAPKVGSLAKFSGRGDKTTTTFRAAANWEIKWGTQAGKQFAVELLDKNGRSRGQVVVATKRAQGSTFVSEAGEFKLKVSATGDWSIEVIGRPPLKQ